MCQPRECDYRTDTQTDVGHSDPYVPLCFAGHPKMMLPTSLWSITEYIMLPDSIKTSIANTLWLDISRSRTWPLLVTFDTLSLDNSRKYGDGPEIHVNLIHIEVLSFNGSVPVDFLLPKFRVVHTKDDIITILMHKYSYTNMHLIKKIISCRFILCWDITSLLKPYVIE